MSLTKASVCLLLSFALIAAAAQAGPPLSGVYDSTDLGGDVAVGRYMEAFDAPNGAVLPGTTLHAQSWDGMTLGTQWSYQCGVLESAPLLITDTVNAQGTGTRTYIKNFVGGTIWLAGDGPWANGDAEYTGPILQYQEIETQQFVNWERVHAVTNVAATAELEGYSYLCLAFTVGNGEEVGSTDFGLTAPADFPTMLDLNCDDTDTYGAWWNFYSLSLYIDTCEVSTEARTWDGVKSLFR